MSHDLLLITAIAVPAVVFIVLRINAALVFLSLCLGAVLTQYVAPEANEMLRMFAPRVGAVSTTVINLSLLLAPAIATAVFMIFSVHGRVKVMLNSASAIAAGALAVLLAVPLLPTGLMFMLQSQQAWKILSKAEALIIGVGALVSLFFLWTQRTGAKHRGKNKH